MVLTPEDLAGLAGGTLEGHGARRIPLADITTDSREVRSGGGFVAVAGEREDGHVYVDDARRRGASLAMVRTSVAATPGRDAPDLLLRVADTAEALRRACRARLDALGCTVVAITGSAGKTTAKELCTAALGRLPVARTLGNLNTWTQIPLGVLRLQPPVEPFVAEVAMSAPGEIRDLARMLRPRVGVLLNIGMAHVGLLGSLEAVAAAKAELLEELALDGVAVCNADDEMVRNVATRSAAPICWFGLRAGGAEYTATDVCDGGLSGIRFTLRGPDGAAQVRLRMPGEHIVSSACAAAAVAARFGIGVAEVAERIAEVEPVAQRGVVLPGVDGAVIYDDSYNSSPAALEAALAVMSHSGMARRVAVVGDMLELGDYADSAHRRAGAAVAAAATRLIAIGDHASTLASAAIAAGMPPEAVSVAADVDDATALARRECRPDTLVLVKASHGLALERVVERLRR